MTVAIINIDSGNFTRHPLGLRDTILRHGWKWLPEHARRLVDEGIERVLIANPNGRYLGAAFGAVWRPMLGAEQQDAFDAFREIVPSPGLNIGTEFWQAGDGTPLPYAMGVAISDRDTGARRIAEISEDDYNLWFAGVARAGWKEIWLDAASKSGRLDGAIRWAREQPSLRVVIESWPLRSLIPGLRWWPLLDPKIQAGAFFATDWFVQRHGLLLESARYQSERYIGILDRNNPRIPREQIIESGAEVVEWR